MMEPKTQHNNQNKTQPTTKSVDEYIQAIQNEGHKKDAEQLVEIFSRLTGESPVMWGPSIVGFGSYHYKYESGREGDSPKLAFAARKQAMTLYGLIFYDKSHENNKLLDELGPHKSGKVCLYIKSLADINIKVLEKMITNSYGS